MAGTARKAFTSVSFNGTDISDVVNKYLMSLSYVDNEEDEADDLQIKLEDRSGIWLQQWLQDFIEKANEYDTSSAATRTTTVNDTHAGIYKSVSKGSSMFDSAICQVYLIALGYLTGEVKVKADANVVAAIKSFQAANSLGVKKKCDSKTWVKLVAAVNGQSIPVYDYTFKAKKKVKIRSAPKSSASEVISVPKGKECVITEKVASGWYRAKYEGKGGYVKGSSLKLSSIADASSSSKVRRMKKLQINASITREDNGKKVTTKCGLFELDDVKASGPPSTVTIKATSLAYSGIRETENDRSWENYTLKGIAEEIADNHGLGVLFDADVDPSYDRVEQSKQTDIALLKKLCQDVGYSLKIIDNQIVIYDQAKYEAMQEIATFTFGDKSYIKWSLSTGDGQVHYDACEVSYTDPATGKAYKGVAYTEEYQEELNKETTKSSKSKSSDEKDSTVETLVITNQRVTSNEEAQNLADKSLKLANKFEREATLTVRGNPNYCAGMTVRLKNWGYWSGKYLISKVKHDVTPNNGYVCVLTLRKVDEVAKPKASATATASKAYQVGDVVNFKGGKHYSSSSKKQSTGGTRRAGPAKITKVTDLSRPHPYHLIGGNYNDLSGDCNVYGWVDKDSFE